MSSDTTTAPVYFELSWAILSSIGLINVFYGILVVGITSLSPITIVPIVVSAAGAVANGMCYYSFYANYSRIPTVVTGVFADLMWLIQEAGMSFYSYQILTKILFQRERAIFLGCFWSMMSVILGIRITIIISRVLDNLQSTSQFQHRINHLHVGYFVSIAIVESISSIFLLRIFIAANKTSLVVFSKNNLFQHLVRSTEIRVASLCLVGITRAITYTFQTTAQSAESIANEVDRFAYTLECLFPVSMMIDILGSKLLGNDYFKEPLPPFDPRGVSTNGGAFSTMNDASIYRRSHTTPGSGSQARYSNGDSLASQNSMGVLSSAITITKAYKHENSTSEQWIDNVDDKGSYDMNDTHDKERSSSRRIMGDVEFELREYP